MIRGHLKSSLWAATGGAAVLSVGAVIFRGVPLENEWWWLLPTMACLTLFISILLGVPVALVVGAPISMWLRHAGFTQARHYVVAGLIVSIIAYGIYLSFRWWWQTDDPMFPTLLTSIRTIGPSAILKFEVIAAICIFLVGPIAAWCYWKSEQEAA